MSKIEELEEEVKLLGQLVVMLIEISTEIAKIQAEMAQLYRKHIETHPGYPKADGEKPQGKLS